MATGMATDRELAEQIEGCILALARLGVEAERGTLDPDAAETVRAVAKLLESYRARHAEPMRDVWTDAVVSAVADVYRGVRAGTVDANEYERLLRAALEPFEAPPTELRRLALTAEQISDGASSRRPVGKDGPVEAARYALAPFLDGMLARRLGALDASRKSASHLRDRQARPPNEPRLTERARDHGCGRSGVPRGPRPGRRRASAPDLARLPVVRGPLPSKSDLLLCEVAPMSARARSEPAGVAASRRIASVIARACFASSSSWCLSY